jgi:radical SAM superfamily enzyme YgiQ (UPF0313 family)
MVIANVDAGSRREGHTLSRALMVLLVSDGLRIPGMDTVSGQPEHGPVPVGLPELLLIARASAGAPLYALIGDVAAECAIDAARLRDFVAKLAARHLLDGSPRPAAPLRRRPAFAAGATAPSLYAPQQFVIATPRLIRPLPSCFEHTDHEGAAALYLTPAELSAMSEFRIETTPREAFQAHRTACGPLALDDAAFAGLLERLAAAQLLEMVVERGVTTGISGRRRGRPTIGRERAAELDFLRFQRLNDAVRQTVRAFDDAEAASERRTGRTRTRVVSVQQNGTIPPLALGLIVAYCKAVDGGRLQEHYAFHPDWLMRPSKVRGLSGAPAVFLYSNYNWSHRHNLAISGKVKALSPWSINVHGGPNTPKYEADCEAYFRNHPDVDVTVRGEGETAVADILSRLAGRIGDGPVDLSVLRDVPGISYRSGDAIVRTPERVRMTDIDVIPSPFLTGLFDAYSGTELAILETNRGCPFTCAFCDWGSATSTKVRLFSIERVFAELEWFAAHRIAGVMCADANFGMYERDVAIAEKVAELKQRFGFPNGFSASAAKNTIKHTRPIIQTLVDAGVMSTGSIGVQSMDPDTLRTVRRSNIKLETYDELTNEFRKARLPLWVDLMFGLPGQTYASFQNDLQACIDRGVFPRMFMTELLVNSPMNEPSFREEHRIQTELSPNGAKHLIVSTASFTREEFVRMNHLRLTFLLCDVIGMLRHVAHYVRHEVGVREVDFYSRLSNDLRERPERWPVMAFAVRALPGLLIPPVSWRLVIEEVRRYLLEEWNLPDDSALGTVLAVQHAVLPARDRVLPAALEVPHDYAAWHGAMTTATQQRRYADWPSLVPPLRSFEPAPFVVTDPDHLCDLGIGAAIDGDLFGNFELHSAVARWARPETKPVFTRPGAVGPALV